MKTPDPRIPRPDPAAIFAIALSVWTSCNELERKDPSINLSDTFNGIDELMRVAMDLATKFEAWSCANVDFDRLSDWWPYKLEEEAGTACLGLINLEDLPHFDDRKALRLALRMKIPLKRGRRPLEPAWVHAANPITGAFFCRISIRSMRGTTNGGGIEPFEEYDDPFDPNYGTPFYRIYGVAQSGKSEHIADRSSLDEAVATAQNLIPGLVFE